MQCCSAVLSEHLWPFSGSLAGWVDTTGPIYWQAEGWGNTSNWQRTSYPKPDLISTHTHTATLTPLWPHPSLCLSPLNSGNVRFVITDLRRVHAVGSHACHYAVWRFLSPCSSLSRPRKSEDWFPVGSCVCVFSGRICIFKTQPWAHCCPVPFLLISQGYGGLSGPGDKNTAKNEGGKKWEHGGFKRRFPFEDFDGRAAQGTCMLEALWQNLRPKTRNWSKKHAVTHK